MRAKIKDPVPELIQHSLHKILSSDLFSSSPQPSKFLRFTVLETLAGRGAYLLKGIPGPEVFDQKDSSDHRLDLRVRVCAMRVRSKLRAYYDGEGRYDPVMIIYHKGSCVPEFRISRHLPETAKEFRMGTRHIAR